MPHNAHPHKTNDSVNQIILEGRLGQDPDIKLTKKGLEIAKFSVITSTLWQDGTREWHQQNHWHNIVVSRESTIRWIRGVLKQGDKVRIKGTLIYRHWKDKHNQCRRTAQILVSDENGSVKDLRSTQPQSGQPINTSDFKTNPENSNEDRLDLKAISFLSHQSPNQSQQQNGETS